MDKLLILKRIKQENNFKTDTELANFLGISKAVLSNWYKRDTIDYDLVLSKCELMDLNWIIRGKKIEIEELSTIPVIDNASMGFILDRYEGLAAENALLKRENEELKLSRGKGPDTIPYTTKSPVTIAAEPAHK